MVDNVNITEGSGTVVAADDISGVKFQRVKLTWGPDGTANDADTATGKPIPVQIRRPDGSEIGSSTTLVKGTISTTGTSEVSLVAAAGASLRNYITSVQLVNSGASATVVSFLDGSGGTVLAYGHVAAGASSYITFPNPLSGSANTALYVIAGTSTTTLFVSAQGYKAA